MGHFRLISDLHTELWPENFYRAAKTVDRLLPPRDEDGDTVLLLAGDTGSHRRRNVYRALVQIAGAGKRPVLYCRDFKLGARHSTLQAQVDLGHPDVPVRIVPCGCDASIRYRRS